MKNSFVVVTSIQNLTLIGKELTEIVQHVARVTFQTGLSAQNKAKVIKMGINW